MHFYLEFKNSQQAHPESVAHSDLCSSTSLPDSFLLFKSISLVRWVGSKMACNDFYLLEVWKEESPLCNFSPLNVAGNCDLHLTNRIQQTWQDVTCMIILHKSVTSVLVADSLFEASCCVVSWTLEMPMWQGTEDSLWPTASMKWRPSVQQFTRNWILPTTIRSWKQLLLLLRIRWNHCSWQHHDCSLVRLEPEDPAKLCLDWQKLWDNKCGLA